MKEILRKIEFYENKKFSQTLKQHKDYTRVLLEITRKLLNNNDSIEEVSLSTQSYLKVVINKQSRIFGGRIRTWVGSGSWDGSRCG